MHLLVDQYQSLSQRLSAEISAAPKSLSGTELRLVVSRVVSVHDFFSSKNYKVQHPIKLSVNVLSKPMTRTQNHKMEK